MDEHLFLVVAKLKADRLKLEREQATHPSAPALSSVRPEHREAHAEPADRSPIQTLEWSNQS